MIGLKIRLPRLRLLLHERQVYVTHPKTIKTIMYAKWQALNGNAAGTLVRHSLDCRKCRVTLGLTILHIVLLATHDDRNISPECIEPTSEEPEMILSIPHEHVHCSRVVDIDRLPVCETVAQTAILHGEDDRVLLVGAVVGQVDVSCFGTRGTRSGVSKPK